MTEAESICESMSESAVAYDNMSQAHEQEESENIKRVLLPKIILMSVIACVVVIGNGVLIGTLLSHKYLRQKSNYFVIALAFADFMLGSVSVPLHVMGEAGVIGESYSSCLVIMAMSSAQIVLSVMMLFALSLERYLKLVHPFLYTRLVTELRVLATILCCVVYSLLFGFLPLFGWNNVQLAPHSTHNRYTCRFQIVLSGSYIGVLFLGHIVPYFLLLPIMHLRVFLTAHNVLKRSSVQRNSVYNQQSLLNRRTSCDRISLSASPRSAPFVYRQRNYRHFKILAVMGVYFIISWMPLTIWEAVLWEGFTKKEVTLQDLLCPPIRMPIYYIVLALAIANSAVNPIIFGAGNTTIRRTLMRLLRINSMKGFSQEDISKSNGSYIDQKFYPIVTWGQRKNTPPSPIPESPIAHSKGRQSAVTFHFHTDRPMPKSQSLQSFLLKEARPLLNNSQSMNLCVRKLGKSDLASV